MGEIADDHLDRMFDRMLDDGYDGYDGYDGWDYAPRSKVCERCRAAGLHWRQTTGSWRLYAADGQLHECNPPSADDFDAIEGQ